jgi:RNA polymerase sigma factor (TIGR02999 family)
MKPAQSGEISDLLRAWGRGEEAAGHLLAAKVYDELRRIARRYMKDERAAHSLQTTALVNEAYLRLVDANNIRWEHRAQFFVIAARMMRRVLVDAARARGAEKRGGGIERVNVEDTPVLSPESDATIVAVHEALAALARIASRPATVVELRYFGGLSVEETAGVMNVSERTVMRDWEFAKAWLARELSQ